MHVVNEPMHYSHCVNVAEYICACVATVGKLMPVFCCDVHVFSHRTHTIMNISVLSSGKSVFIVAHGKPYKEGSSIRRRLIGDYLPSGRQGADNCTVTARAAMGGTSGRLRFGPVLIGHFSPLSANEESLLFEDTFPMKSCIRAEPVARTVLKDDLRNVIFSFQSTRSKDGTVLLP